MLLVPHCLLQAATCLSHQGYFTITTIITAKIPFPGQVHQDSNVRESMMLERRLECTVKLLLSIFFTRLRSWKSMKRLNAGQKLWETSPYFYINCKNIGRHLNNTHTIVQSTKVGDELRL